MSVFNLNTQNASLDQKLVVGLERLSQVFRILLWDKAKEYKLSPIQIQLLIFVHHHHANLSTVSYLAQEFNVTKPTISDAIKSLSEKKYINKLITAIDTRSFYIQLTPSGKKVVKEIENYTEPINALIKGIGHTDKLILWEKLSGVIDQLHKSEIIQVQRMCYHCKFFLKKNSSHYCQLLNQKLKLEDIRLDCQEFESR